MKTPTVSVVVPVFNGQRGLKQTLVSISSQTYANIEIVAVDDGSTDKTQDILEGYQRLDGKVRVVRQDNMGITRALMLGCRMASGSYIARHDVGDKSSPERVREQVEVLNRYPDVSVVSCWIRYRGPEGEPAGGVRHDPEKADENLKISRSEQLRVRGPYHGSTMFRKADYEAVGGYRSEFYFAQDVDLWLRLHECGRHYIVPEELYTAQLDPDSISGRYRAEQDRCLELAVSAARARRVGESEAPYLARAARIRPSSSDGMTRKARLRAGSLYSMGCQLLAESPGSASRYFIRSLKVYPFNPKAWVRLVESVGRRCRLLS